MTHKRFEERFESDYIFSNFSSGSFDLEESEKSFSNVAAGGRVGTRGVEASNGVSLLSGNIS